MLTYIQKLPEAKLWAKFPLWFQALEKDNEDEMVALLRSFTTEDVTYVLRFLRTLDALGYDAYMILGLARDMLKICRFFCYVEADLITHRSSLPYVLPSGFLLAKLLAIYKPDWFTKIYSRYLRDPKNVDYATSIALERAGVPVLTPATTPKKLVDFFQKAYENSKSTQELDAEYPEIFDRDIWTLFSEKATSMGEPRLTTEYYERSLPIWQERLQNWCSFAEMDKRIRAILGPPQYTPFNLMGTAVVEGIAAKRLDRARVLRETLLGICRNLEKEQPAGFTDFFTALNPSPQELFDLQDELMAVLSCPHNKSRVAILKHLKTIIKHKDCALEPFINVLPVLLCSRVKSLYTVTLSVAEDLAKHSPAAGAQLCYAIPSIFSAPDESAQVRGAHFLNTYGDATDANLRAEIATWRSSLTVGALALLATFIDATGDNTEHATAEATPTLHSISHLDESRRISLPQNLEECLFLLTEAFCNPAEYHCSLVPDALFVVQDELTDASFHLIGPAIEAARRAVCRIDKLFNVHCHSYTLHFLRYCIVRLETAQGKNVAGLKEKLPDMITETSSQYTIYQQRAHSKEYRSFIVPSLQNVFHTFDQVAEVAFSRLHTRDTLPMLSSVTHAPCWIDPLELISRLLLWQQAGREPHSMDLQLALQRCAREKTHEALAAAQALKGEYKELFTYFLGDKPSLPSRRAHPAWWVTAALMRPERRVPQELLEPDFADIPPEYFNVPFQWSISQHEHWANPEGELTLTTTQFVSLALPQKKHAHDYWYSPSDYWCHPCQLDEIDATGKWRELFCGRMFLGSDVSWLNQALALYPNNPEPLVMDFIAAYAGEKYPKIVRFLEKLLELRVPMGRASHLLLALSFVAGVKEPRLYAAAFWRTKVEEGQIDCAELGHMLGRLERHKWVPIKRFIDIVDKELLAVSPLHSAQLAIMLEAMLLELGPEPPVAIKRILEIYYELTAAQGKKVPAAMLPLLDAWATAKPQAVVCKKLQKLG